jgi:hypothetical protein
MEMLIVLVGFSAAAGGAMVLLVCLAGKRAQLVKAFNMQQEQEMRQKQVKENQAKQKQNQPVVAQPLSED